LLTLDIPAIASDDLLRKLFYNYNAHRSTIILYTDEYLKDLTIEFYYRFLKSHNMYKLNMPSISPNSLNELYNISQTTTHTHILLKDLKKLPRITTFNKLTNQQNTIVIFICKTGATNHQLFKFNAEWYELN
jgi:hypothetical protein